MIKWSRNWNTCLSAGHSSQHVTRKMASCEISWRLSLVIR